MGRRNACHCASHVATQGLAWLLGVEGSVWKRLHEDAIRWEGSVIMGALTRSRSLRWSHRLRKYFHLPSMLLLLIMSSLFLTSFSKLHLWITSVTQGNNDLAFCSTLKHYFCTSLVCCCGMLWLASAFVFNHSPCLWPQPCLQLVPHRYHAGFFLEQMLHVSSVICLRPPVQPVSCFSSSEERCPKPCCLSSC